MNKKINIKGLKRILPIAAISMMCLSCTGNFESMNKDTNTIPEDKLEADMLAVGAFFPAMQLNIIPVSDPDANDYQRAQNLTGDIFSGYMAAIGQWNGSSNNSTYNLYFDDWRDESFTIAFKNVVSGYLDVKKNAIKYNLPEPEAVARILKVASLHRVSDIHGPIPYTKAGEGALGSVYDPQDVVYENMIKDLTEAVEILTEFVEESPQARPLAKYDLVYGGNYAGWVKFANSLKLRLAMRMVYADPVNAKKYAEEAVAQSLGVMISNADNATLKSGLGVQVYNPLEVCWNSYGDCRIGASLESYMKGYNDPRIPKYIQEAKVGGIHGVRNGLRISNKSDYTQYSAPNVAKTTPVNWMTAAEIALLRAEGAARGWNMSSLDGLSSAEDLYNKGIELSFAYHGLSSDYATYIANATDKPVRYEDYLGRNSAQPLSSITVKWEEGVSLEKKLERIITQKWLAMFPEGQEAWSEYRRTGYPKLFPVVTNLSSGQVDTDKQVRRMPFPASEYKSNPNSVEAAVGLLGGQDTGGTQVWWDQK